MQPTRFFLSPTFFSDRETLLLDAGELQAYAFRYPSGVCAIRLQNQYGSLIVLPFQGQQIWSVNLRGRNLTMRSMFDQPHPTQTYLENYGAFLIHCGATAMGVPVAAAGDTHPLHGELPNARYETAWLSLASDEKGDYLELSGQYHHTVAFNTNYVAEPYTRLYAGKSLFWVGMQIINLKKTAMELMYLAHINFRPVDHARLVYSAPYDAKNVRPRTSIPSHVKTPPGFAAFLSELAAHPEIHHDLKPELAFDPEVVFYIDYLTDEAGWSHTLHVHPNGEADYVRHRPDQLCKGVRWICRTPDQDAMGMLLPATAEPEGYAAEKAKGNVMTLAAGATWRCDYEIGALNAADAAQTASAIDHIAGR